MLTVGTDSYVTITDADGYISRNYRSNSSDRSRWDNLTEEDKEIILRQAFSEIERLPLCGRKYVTDQKLQFPRVRFGDYQPPPDCPDEVKAAQIELALWLSDDKLQADISQRQSRQAQCMNSISVGSMSESYENCKTYQSVIRLCYPANILLLSWLNGGYEVV